MSASAWPFRTQPAARQICRSPRVASSHGLDGAFANPGRCRKRSGAGGLAATVDLSHRLFQRKPVFGREADGELAERGFSRRDRKPVIGKIFVVEANGDTRLLDALESGLGPC